MFCLHGPRVAFEGPQALHVLQLRRLHLDPMVDVDSDKATVVALREIAEGLITPEILARETEIEAEEEFAASFETPIL